MGSLDVDPLFTKIPLEETIDICPNKRVEGLPEIELKELFYLLLSKNPILFLMKNSPRKSMESQWVLL